ncbi:hypothetical protein ACR0RE_11240 [Staphylococcus haemolyticus]
MTIFDMPNYLWITIVAMIILTVFCALVLKKWFVSAVITSCVSCLSIFIPNFYDISFQPLLGYAAFLAIISLIISFLLWYFTRNWRRERKKKQLEKEIRKYEDDDETIRRLRR